MSAAGAAAYLVRVSQWIVDSSFRIIKQTLLVNGETPDRYFYRDGSLCSLTVTNNGRYSTVNLQRFQMVVVYFSFHQQFVSFFIRVQVTPLFAGCLFIFLH